MATSQRGVAVGEGVRRSAKDRRCPECKRHGALVRRDLEGVRYAGGTVAITLAEVACRWVYRSLCSFREQVRFDPH